MKNELNAVILQTILTEFWVQALQWLPLFGKLIRGALQNKANPTFHCLCYDVSDCYITNWMKHNAIGILSYVGTDLAAYRKTDLLDAIASRGVLACETIGLTPAAAGRQRANANTCSYSGADIC